MLNREFVRFGSGGETCLLPLTIGVLLAAGILLFVLPRRHVFSTFMLVSLAIPISQNLVLAGVNFRAFRLLLILAWTRVLLRGPSFRSIRLNAIDRVVVLWGVSTVLTFSLLWLNAAALANRIVFLFDALGVYFLARLCHPTEKDILRTAKGLAIACLVLAMSMVAEHRLGTNLFTAVGGRDPEIRDGFIRAQGPFAHPIIAGTCAATLAPLLAALWWLGEARALAGLGIAGAIAISISSGSSTALGTLAAGATGLAVWRWHRHLRMFRWATVAALIGLHLTMKAPVWALLARVDFTGGSSAYHRYELVNQTILHFTDWCLVGQRSTYQWGFNLWDTANTYVETAITGGLPTLLLLFAILARCFGTIGRSITAVKNPATARLLWGLGASLFATTIGFIGITYWDQSIVIWLTQIALISSAGVLASRSAQVRATRG